MFNQLKITDMEQKRIYIVMQSDTDGVQPFSKGFNSIADAVDAIITELKEDEVDDIEKYQEELLRFWNTYVREQQTDYTISMIDID